MGLTITEINQLQAENERLKAQVEALEKVTYCAYCGQEFPLDTSTEAVITHIYTCPKHPLPATLARAKRLEEALRSVEWFYTGRGDKTCISCETTWDAYNESAYHYPRCVIKAALAEGDADAAH